MDTTRRGFMGSAAAFAAVGATAGDAGAKGKHVLVSYTWSIDNIGDMGIHTGLLTLFRDAGGSGDNAQYLQGGHP